MDGGYDDKLSDVSTPFTNCESVQVTTSCCATAASVNECSGSESSASTYRGSTDLPIGPAPVVPRKLDAPTIVSEILLLLDDPSLAAETHWTVVKLCRWLHERKEIALLF